MRRSRSVRKQTRFASLDQTRDTLALLMILALTGKQAEEGSLRSVKDSFTAIRTRIAQRRLLR